MFSDISMFSSILGVRDDQISIKDLMFLKLKIYYRTFFFVML